MIGLRARCRSSSKRANVGNTSPQRAVPDRKTNQGLGRTFWNLHLGTFAEADDGKLANSIINPQTDVYFETDGPHRASLYVAADDLRTSSVKIW